MQTNTNTTSLTAAVREILTATPAVTVKQILDMISLLYPNVKASYRPVYNTAKRLRGATPKQDLAAAVLAHAQAHYNEGGWDVIVETMTAEEITTELAEAEVRTVEGAIRHYAELADVWSERQADAVNSAF